MGECAFGRGFGSVKDSTPEPGINEEAWKSIPDAIFNGLSRRYQLVYFKRAFRLLGIHFTFDWPREMITVCSGIVESVVNGSQVLTRSPRPSNLSCLAEARTKRTRSDATCCNI